MQFSIKNGAPARVRTGCIVAGVFESRKLTPAGTALDRASHGYLSTLLKRGDLDGKVGSSMLLPRVPHILAERVLLIGLGREADFGKRQFRDAVRNTARVLDQNGIPDGTLCLSAASKDHDLAWRVMQAVIVAAETAYRFDRMKSKTEQRRRLTEFSLLLERGESVGAAAAFSRGIAIAHGMELARDLGNLPPNVCTPTYLAAQARLLGRSHRLKVRILEKREMERLGMGALLAVARGSLEPPKLIVLHYQGGERSRKPIVLVGKGVTFDSGGISIKPAADMDEMKFDMCGGASVLGTLKATAEMKLPLNVIGIVPATENMPSGTATKPGDIVTTLSGQTVEILNTDAEGRLILCDALSYAERFQPQTVVDIATLTGACVIALGHIASGLFANDETLAEELLAAGNLSYDRLWRLPLWDDYQEQLRSNFADFSNIGGRPAGSVTAACFLARFTRKYKWAHLDIAGTAWKSGREKGATGRPVPLLAQFLIDRADR